MIYRLYPTKDTWISNVQRLGTPQTGSNYGASETLELFKLAGVSGAVGPASSSSLSRLLLKFDLSEISSLTASSRAPSSGISYFLKLTSAAHLGSQPSSFDVEIDSVSRDWDEGTGIDSDDHTDKGFANWDRAMGTVPWTTRGGDFSSVLSSSAHFDTGFEDLSVDVTPLVNSWLTGGLANNGFLVRLSGSQESDSSDYYRKVFFSRQSSFSDKRPTLEARWDDSVKDDRSTFVFDNTGSLYLYYRVRGQPANIPGVSLGQNVLTVRISDLSGTIKTVSASFTGLTGVYSASFAIPTGSYSGSRFSDVWFSGSNFYLSGSFTPAGQFSFTDASPQEYTVRVKGLKKEYELGELVRFSLFIRPKDFSPAVVSSASFNPPVGMVMTKAYYRVDNDSTNRQVIGFGTGSVEWTRMSYDDLGNYFSLYMSTLSAGEVYRFMFLFEVDGQKRIVEGAKFRVI